MKTANTFKPFQVGEDPDAYRVTQSDDPELFGFVKSGSFYRTLRLSDSGWDDMACQVLSHPLTEQLAPHLHLHDLWCYGEPARNAETIREMRASIERFRGVYGPEAPISERRFVESHRAFEIGRVVCHASHQSGNRGSYNGYRMMPKDRNPAQTLLISWEMLCEICATWLRDERTHRFRPDIFVPWFVLRPKSDFQGLTLRPGAKPMERLQAVPDVAGAAVTDLQRQLGEVRALAQSLLQACLGLSPDLSPKIGFILKTVDPALSGLLDALGELGAPEIALVDLVGAQAKLDERQQQLDQQETQLNQRSEALESESSRLERLRESLASDVKLLFGTDEERILREGARIREEAAELDRQREALTEERAGFAKLQTEMQQHARALREACNRLVT